MKLKKIAAFLLALVLAVTCIPAASAAKAEKNVVIVIGGFTSSSLYLNYGTEEEEQVWSIGLDDVGGQIKDDIGNFLLTLMAVFIGKPEIFGKTLGQGTQVILEKMRCNPDGTSVYPLEHYPNDPAISSYKYLMEELEGEGVVETHLCDAISPAVGDENIFIFHNDFRMSASITAKELRKYVLDVLEYTGVDKVDIFGLSHGGQILGTYLNMYCNDTRVDNAVMSVPALGGTYLGAQLLNGNMDIAVYELLQFLETAVSPDTGIARFLLTGALASFASGLGNGFSEGVRDLIVNWGCVWDFVPAEIYDETKTQYLDSKKNAGLIALSDYYHYDIIPNFNKRFTACQKTGTSVSITCNTGTRIALGERVNSDIIIHTNSVSGAYCAPFGERFALDYTPKNTTCANPKHNHISPSGEIDASCAYLPENTWFIEDQYHGMYAFEEYTMSLIQTLLLTDDIKNVHSDPAYPQFEISQHEYLSVYAKLDKSPSGYATPEDSELIIRNLSSYPMAINSVTGVDFYDVDFAAFKAGIIRPGEQVSISVKGELKDGRNYAKLYVSYTLIGSPTPVGIREFDFTTFA